MVRVTVSCSAGCTSPSRAVQRIRLWASTAQASQAALAKNRPDGQCSRPAPPLQVADGELDRGVIAVELVDFDGGQFDVGDERVVAPVGPQSPLGGVGEASAAHDQSQLASVPPLPGHVHALGDLGLAAVGVGDRCPRRLVDRVDRGADAGVDAHRDRPPDPETRQRVDERVVPEPGVGAHGQRAGGAGSGPGR